MTLDVTHRSVAGILPDISDAMPGKEGPPVNAEGDGSGGGNTCLERSGGIEGSLAVAALAVRHAPHAAAEGSLAVAMLMIGAGRETVGLDLGISVSGAGVDGYFADGDPPHPLFVVDRLAAGLAEVTEKSS